MGVGFHATQETASPALKRWQSVRRVVMKRPGLATVEKFLDTAGASLFVGSAFHPPYTEKMADVAEGMGMPASVVVRACCCSSFFLHPRAKRMPPHMLSITHRAAKGWHA
jgi:anthranilate phosphoribosyltransferase